MNGYGRVTMDKLKVIRTDLVRYYNSKSYQAKQTKSECVYCEKPDHRSSDCKTAKTVKEHR